MRLHHSGLFPDSVVLDKILYSPESERFTALLSAIFNI